MSDDKDDSFVPCKKFKYSFEEEETCCSETEENVLPSSKAEAEAGSYFLGPAIKKYVSSPVTVCLGRKKGTNEYYLMKMLVLDDSNMSDRGLYIRRTVFHNEYTILSYLKHHDGIIQLHDFFKNYFYKETEGKKQKLKRVCMAMECLFPHGPYNTDLIPLNYFLKEEKLTETQALHILYNLLCVIEKMHKTNVVHREIKLSNIILNRKTLKVKLMDFYYAKVISSNSEAESCKSTVSSGLPKTSDVWAAGVVFYAMLCSGYSAGMLKFGSLLSSVHSAQDLYLKLEENKCALLKNTSVTVGSKEILCCILCSLPQYRLKASEAADMVSTLLAIRSSSQNPSSVSSCNNLDQIVPECSDFVCSNQQKNKISTVNSVSKVPEVKESEKKNDKNNCEKENKIYQIASDKDNKSYQVSSVSSRLSKENGLLNREDIKFAMMRLGATSLNSINALSFNYNKRNSCPL